MKVILLTEKEIAEMKRDFAVFDNLPGKPKKVKK